MKVNIVEVGQASNVGLTLQNGTCKILDGAINDHRFGQLAQANNQIVASIKVWNFYKDVPDQNHDQISLLEVVD